MLSVGIRDSGHEAPIIKAFIGLHHGISRATGGRTNVRSVLLKHRTLHLLGTDHSVVCLCPHHTGPHLFLFLTGQSLLSASSVSLLPVTFSFL